MALDQRKGTAPDDREGADAVGITGPTGTAWGPSTLHGNKDRGTGLLNSDHYVGRLVWNRLRYIKDPETGKRVSRLNRTKDWIIAGRSAPAHHRRRPLGAGEGAAGGTPPGTGRGMKPALSRLARELDRLVEAIVQGIPADRVKDRMTALDAERSILETRLAGQPDVAPPLSAPQHGRGLPQGRRGASRDTDDQSGQGGGGRACPRSDRADRAASGCGRADRGS